MKLIRFAPLTLAITFVSAPADALDLTGTWSGKFNCSNFDGLKFNSVDKNQTLKITQPQPGQNVYVEWVGVAKFTGVVIDNQKNPDSKGQVAMADCSTSPELNAFYAEIAKLSASVNRSKSKGSLSGTSIYSIPESQNAPQTVGQCKWNFKLVDPQDPGVGAGCQ